MPADTPRFTDDLERDLRHRVRSVRAERRRRRAYAATVAVALAFAVVTGLGTPSEDQGPRAAQASGFDFGDQRMRVLGELSDDEIAALERAFAKHGAQLVVHRRLVVPAKAGQVFSVQVPSRDALDRDGYLRVDGSLSGPVIIEVGRAPRDGEDPGTSGQRVWEVQPQLCDLVDPQDPQATARRLAGAGYDVTWTLLVPTAAGNEGRRVDAPPAGTVITSYDQLQDGTRAPDPDARTLWLELASPEQARELGHGHGEAVGC